MSQEPLGEVFTRRWVVDWMLDLAGYTADRDLADAVFVEPSCGSGAFVIPAIERLLEAARRQQIPLDALGDSIWAADLHEPSVEATREATKKALAEHGASDALADALADKWVHHEDYLLADVPVADYAVGNPPYVRHDEIPADLASKYRALWPTMRGRCDLYVPFYERSLVGLADGGVAAFICADRWMRNQYGRELRSLVDRSFNVEAVVRMHQVDAFEEEVDAYPAITVIRRGQQGDGVLSDCDRDFTGADVARADEALRQAGDAGRASAPRFSAVRIPGWFGGSEWPEGSPEGIENVKRWEASLPSIEDAAGTRIGIGVATGADRVFIVRGEQPDVEPERLMPMVMSKHLRTGAVEWTPTWLVNPWDADGVVLLDEWPKLARYFKEHLEAVRRRSIARRNPERWHRTIDRVHPDLASTPKILLADMAERMTPVVDTGEFYPHHNLYWITSESWDIYVLAGLLLSDQAEAFIRAYCVKMRGGTLRMQAQYLRKIRIPAPSDLSAADRHAFRAAYESSDRAAATRAAEKFYV
jgi:hypothetical protein